MNSKERLTTLPPDWRAAVDAWLERIESASGSIQSRQKYTSTLGVFVHFLNENGGRSLDDATRADVDAFSKAPSFLMRHSGRAVPVSMSCRNTRVSILSSFYRYCAAHEVTPGQALYTKQIPTTGIPFLRLPSKPRSLSKEQLTLLFAQIDRSTLRGKRDYSLLLFLLLSARRVSEVLRLTWGDLSYTTVVDGSQRRQAWTYGFSSKGRSRSHDSAEIGQVAIDAVFAWLEASGRKEHMESDTPLWIALHAGPGSRSGVIRPLSYCQAKMSFQAYLRAAGLPVDGLHILRHCSAKILYESGLDIRAIQRELRHTSIATTSRYLESLCTTASPGQAILASALPFLMPGSETKHV